jgi:hypothetical protein
MSVLFAKAKLSLVLFTGLALKFRVNAAGLGVRSKSSTEQKNVRLRTEWYIVVRT